MGPWRDDGPKPTFSAVVSLGKLGRVAAAPEPDSARTTNLRPLYDRIIVR